VEMWMVAFDAALSPFHAITTTRKRKSIPCIEWCLFQQRSTRLPLPGSVLLSPTSTIPITYRMLHDTNTHTVVVPFPDRILTW